MCSLSTFCASLLCVRVYTFSSHQPPARRSSSPRWRTQSRRLLQRWPRGRRCRPCARPESRRRRRRRDRSRWILNSGKGVLSTPRRSPLSECTLYSSTVSQQLCLTCVMCSVSCIPSCFPIWAGRWWETPQIPMRVCVIVEKNKLPRDSREAGGSWNHPL